MFWMTEEMKVMGEVWEVVAVDRHQAHFLVWRSEGEVQPGSVLQLGPGEDAQAIGAGVRNEGIWSTVCSVQDWTNGEGYLVETTGDCHLQDGSNTCRVQVIKERWVQANWRQEEDSRLVNPEWRDAEIYTDGSLFTTGTFESRACTGGSVTAGASVVKDNGDGTYDAIRATGGICR
jgi:hypothetical protein